jgi:hypothetical protein
MKRGEKVFEKGEMVLDERGAAVSCDEAGQVFFGPPSFMTNTDIPNLLKPQSFFPYRYGHPKGAGCIFKPVAGNPCGAPRELHVVENNQEIRPSGLVKKAGERGKIGLDDGEDHG